MRRKIDEVKRLSNEVEELERRLAGEFQNHLEVSLNANFSFSDRERQLQAAHSELLQKNLILQTLASTMVQN